MGVAVPREPVGTRSPVPLQKFGHGLLFVGQLLSRNRVSQTNQGEPRPLKQALPQPWSPVQKRNFLEWTITRRPLGRWGKNPPHADFFWRLWSINTFSMHPTTEFLRKKLWNSSRLCGHTFNFLNFFSLEVSRETRITGVCSRHCLLLPQPGYVYGRELRVAAMKFEISGFTVLPRPPLDGPDKKHWPIMQW